MAKYFEQKLYVDTRDIDGHNHCRPSALLGLLQEAATQAAIDLDVSRERMLEDYNLFWMLARIWYRLERPLHWGEEIVVRTWHRGNKGATMYRDFDIYCNDKWVGESVSAWVLADSQTHRIARLSSVAQLIDSGGEELCKHITLSKLHLPDMQPAGMRMMHYSDTDINAHVNNNRYADFACDAVELFRRPQDVFVQQMQVGYLAECRPGEEIALSIAKQGEEFYVLGSGADKPRFETKLVLRKTDEKQEGKGA